MSLTKIPTEFSFSFRLTVRFSLFLNFIKYNFGACKIPVGDYKTETGLCGHYATTILVKILKAVEVNYIHEYRIFFKTSFNNLYMFVSQT